jgi:cell wall-associated NlpC family hydrolase
MSDWTQAYARALGVKWTPEVGSRLASWQRWEGGHTNNSARNNYMNTKMSMPGSWDAIGNGVQGYKTLAQGAQAFARTIGDGAYSPALKTWLATGQGDPSRDLGVWVAGPHAATTPSAQAYAAKVLGTHAAPTPPSSYSTPPSSSSTPPDASPSLLSADTGAASIRTQALKGFGDIAAGGDAVQSFGDMAGLLKTLHAAAPPMIHPQTQAVADANPGGLEAQAVKMVHKYLGVKYTWGGTSAKTGFDCSGLLYNVWGSLGVKIPRTSEAQWAKGTPVDLAHLKPGDAVFTEMRSDGPGHVGMYIGGGKIIAAPHTGTVVQVQNLSDWKVAGARRFA